MPLNNRPRNAKKPDIADNSRSRETESRKVCLNSKWGDLWTGRGHLVQRSEVSRPRRGGVARTNDEEEIGSGVGHACIADSNWKIDDGWGRFAQGVLCVLDDADDLEVVEGIAGSFRVTNDVTQGFAKGRGVWEVEPNCGLAYDTGVSIGVFIFQVTPGEDGYAYRRKVVGGYYVRPHFSGLGLPGLLCSHEFVHPAISHEG
jgi:hypothetical protein